MRDHAAPFLRGFVVVSIAGTFAHVGAAQCSVVTHPAVAGWPGAVYCYTVDWLPDGGLLVGGEFTWVGNNMPAARVAKLHDGVWSTFGPGVGGPGAGEGVMSSVVLPSGDAVVGGAFQYSGTTLVNNVARWDGAAWQPFGTGVTGGYGYTWIDHMVVMPNGDLVVGGRFYAPVPWLARWNGTSWSSIGGGGWEGIGGLAVAQNGDLLVAYADGSSNGARVMRWNGATWTQLGSGTPQWWIDALHVSPSGEIFAGGQQPALARWTGSTWAPVGALANASVRAIESLPDGDLVVAGSTGSTANTVYRWNGSAMVPLTGLGAPGVTVPFVLDLAWQHEGKLALAGLFSTVNGQAAGNVATLSSSCPPDATSYGAGCTGGGGVVSLAPTQWAMLGGAMRARTTGLAANSLAVGVWGFSPINIPLSSGHPAGAPGCNVLVADQILLELLVGNGAVDSFLAVPNNAALIGMTLHHQVIPIELGASGNILAITASNALIFTIGSF